MPLDNPAGNLNFTIKYSARRRTMAIKLYPDGHWEMQVPLNASDEQIRKAFEHFRPWLEKKLHQLQNAPPENQAHKFDFAIGKSFFFLGEELPLQHQMGSLSGIISFRNGALWSPSAEPEKIKLMLEAFYRRQARRLITGKLEHYCRKFGVKIGEISINGARKRFGSCNSRGDLNFSYHLAMYPEKLIELVILHELAHRSEMNHSPAFYRVLSSYLPDHRERNKLLRIWSCKLSAYPD